MLRPSMRGGVPVLSRPTRTQSSRKRAASRSDGGDTTVALSKPDAETMNIGKDILFPTEHIERIIAHAKAGGGTMEARVYDGSDTGKKVFQTLTVIGREATTPTPESEFAATLGRLADGVPGADLLVTSTVDLAGAPGAFDTLRTPGEHGKILVTP